MSSTLHNQVDAILERFGAEVGLDDCRLDDESCARFGLDGVLVDLMLDEAAASLLLMTTIGRPRETVEAYARLLDANLFFAETAGAALAREAGSNIIVLQRQLAVEGLDLARFESALKALVDVAERLRAELGEAEADRTEEDDPLAMAREVPEHFVRA